MEWIENLQSSWNTLAVIVGCLFFFWSMPILWRVMRIKFRHRRRLRRAFAGESSAEHLLLASGYRLIHRQPKQSWTVFVDGSPQQIQLRADLLVERKGKRFVAEVKTGSHAPHIKTSSTRRQLLEYCIAYDVDGVLLLDMEHEAIREIDFPLSGISAVKTQNTGWISAMLFAGIAFFSWLMLSDLSLLRKLIEHLDLFFP